MGKCKLHSLRCTSGATPADLLTASMTASDFLTGCSRGRSWLGMEWAFHCLSFYCYSNESNRKAIQLRTKVFFVFAHFERNFVK